LRAKRLMKKKSIVREVAKFIAIYDGDSEEENMELARQIVAKVRRHLTKRATDLPPVTREKGNCLVCGRSGCRKAH
jgi:hypothetical protein